MKEKVLKLRSLILLLTLIVILSIGPSVTIFAYYDTHYDYRYTYEILQDNTIEITKYSGFLNSGELVIPSIIDNKIVSRIGEYAFSNTGFNSIKLPENLKSIGTSAFSDCYITNMTLPSSLVIIEDRAFVNCTKLTNINLPENLKSIGSAAFRECINLKTIKIPNSVTEIGSMAFTSTGLESVILPENLSVIEYATFVNCVNLTSIIVPNNVTSIGESAFGNCTNLTEITIPNKLNILGIRAFYDTKISTININGSLTKVEADAYKDFLLAGNIDCSNANIKFIADEDVNKDGKFDILDLSDISIHYNKVKSSVGFNKTLDFNNDSIIDLYDLIKVSKLI